MDSSELLDKKFIGLQRGKKRYFSKNFRFTFWTHVNKTVRRTVTGTGSQEIWFSTSGNAVCLEQHAAPLWALVSSSGQRSLSPIIFMTHFNTQILMTRENLLCLEITRFNSSLKAGNGVGDALLKMRQERKSVGAFKWLPWSLLNFGYGIGWLVEVLRMNSWGLF